MTKKRFKMSMAALGLLAAFFMVLIAVLLAPTLASANKDPGTAHRHGGMPETGPLHGGSGGASHIFAENWNETGHDHGNAFDTSFCVEGGVIPCNDGDAANGYDGGGDPDRFIGDFAAGGGAHGDGGTSNGGGRFGPNFWGGPGGGEGGGHDGGKSDKKDDGHQDDGHQDDGQKGGDKPKTDDPQGPLLDLTPTDGDPPSIFVDLPPGDGDPHDGPKDGPKGDGPTITTFTSVTDVPEPLTVFLFGAGLAGVAGLRRRSRRQA